MHGWRSSWGVKVQYMQLALRTSSCRILIAVDLLKVQRFYLDSQVQFLQIPLANEFFVYAIEKSYRSQFVYFWYSADLWFNSSDPLFVGRKKNFLSIQLTLKHFKKIKHNHLQFRHVEIPSHHQ